jgi:repressor LexA
MMAGASRGIRVVEEANPGLPIVGRVAAGEPILAQEHIEDYCEIPPSFFKPAADYLLEVHGDSMMEMGILDGDYIAVHRMDSARNGEVVVARVDNEVTVKRYEKKRSKVVLHPENKDYQPIEVDLKESDFAIEGLYVGVLRRN